MARAMSERTMKHTHTPGPWKPLKGADGDETRWVVVQNVDGGREYLIATIENGAPGDYLETEGMNARLIAASPIMLDALKAARSFIRNGIALGFIRMPDEETHDPASAVPDKIDAAIAHAEAPDPAAEER